MCTHIIEKSSDPAGCDPHRKHQITGLVLCVFMCFYVFFCVFLCFFVFFYVFFMFFFLNVFLCFFLFFCCYCQIMSDIHC